MSVTIRLARGGAKKKPHYRLVVADSRFAATGRFIENVGRYDPMLDKKSENRFIFDETRVKYWLSVGAQPSSRVHILLSKKGLLTKKSLTEQTKQHLPKKGTLEKQKAKEEKQKAATPAPQEAKEAESSAEAPKEEAKEAAKEEVKTEAETPKEETKTEAPKEEVKAEEAKTEAPKEEAKAEEAKPATVEASKEAAAPETPKKEESPKPEPKS